MNKGHIHSGEVVNLGKLKKDLDTGATNALVRTKDMEVIRMTIPKGKEIREHSVEGELTLQCLRGAVEFKIGDVVRNLTKEDWLFLDRNVSHALKAEEDTVLLLTILFAHH